VREPDDGTIAMLIILTLAFGFGAMFGHWMTNEQYQITKGQAIYYGEKEYRCKEVTP
jgi:hypothetical protein